MLETHVKKVAEPFGLDIIAIIAMIEAIMALFENCPERPSAVVLKEPGILARARLRRQLRKRFEENDCCSVYRRKVGAIAAAIEAHCETMSVEDCQCCVDEILGA